MMDERESSLIRCRRLGHEVTFAYCRRESGGAPCRLMLDCWWETFDVREYLSKSLPPEALEKLEAEKAPPPKIASLLDLIEQARKRVTESDNQIDGD